MNSGNALVVQRLDGKTDGHASQTLAIGDRGDIVVGASFSPDGQWIVYATGPAVFVQPSAGPGLRRQIFDVDQVAAQEPRTTGVRTPRWRRDGREIVFYGAPDRIYSVPVTWAGGQPQFGAPVVLFSGVRRPAGSTASSVPLAISRDGSRIYWLQGPARSDADVIHIRTNALH
jgi:hypothetical protein